jgi:hypothetical protein
MHWDISKYNFAIIMCEVGQNNDYVMNDSLVYIPRQQVGRHLWLKNQNRYFLARA